jgi:hypothetical protein
MHFEVGRIDPDILALARGDAELFQQLAEADVGGALTISPIAPSAECAHMITERAKRLSVMIGMAISSCPSR